MASGDGAVIDRRSTRSRSGWGGADARTYTSRGAEPVPREAIIQLQLETRTEGDWTVLDVGGEVDLFTAPSLREQVNTLVEGGVRNLLVNLERVGFMDSSGLGVLVAGLKRLKEAGGEMALVCRNGPALKVLTITGLDHVFPIHASVAEAVGS